MRLRKLLLLGFLLLTLPACTLPGAASPTPFTFPTPNLTHTAIFAATPTHTPLPPTLPPLEIPDTSTPTPATPPGETPASTPTLTPLPVSTDVRPHGAPVLASYLSAPPTLDGDLSDWAGSPYLADKVLAYASGGWTGPSDLSASYYVGWDTAALYLGVQRTDDTFVQVSSGRYMYKGDDVEIQLDLDLPGDYHSTSLSADDYQIGLSPGNFGSLGEEAYLWYPRWLEQRLGSVQVSALKTAYGYDLEARIPWTVFGITPVEGQALGFALSLSDNDLSGLATWQSMVSSVETRRLADPTTWGTLILEAPSGK